MMERVEVGWGVSWQVTGRGDWAWWVGRVGGEMMKKCSIFLMVGLLVTGCRRPAGGEVRRDGGGVVPVLAAAAVRRDLPVQLQAIGRVVAVASVAVKPQVTGRVVALHFAEGDEVEEGDLLVTMDARPFEVALGQAQAELAEAVSGSDHARDQARRYTELNRSGGASKEQIEQYVTAAQQSAARVESARAAVQKAELELAYCSLRAAIPGRTGRHLVTPGNVVTANVTDLVVINQIAPIDVAFSVPEQHLAALQAGLAAGAIKATALLGGPEPRRVEGALRFIDNTVRAGAGTIELKAGFANDPPVLWPGQFVTVILDVAMQRDAVLIPASAPQPGQDGFFVFVVGDDRTVKVQPVRVERTQGEEAVVADGLQGGEVVVTDGHSRLTRGTRVEVKESLEAAAAAALRPQP